MEFILCIKRDFASGYITCICVILQFMELERMLEIETEQRKKDEATLEEVMEKLKVGCVSFASY